jgi:hypothetical protein
MIKSSTDKPGRKKKRPGSSADKELKALVPEGLAHAFVESKLHDKALALAGLGAPSDWEGVMPELPNDIGALDHDDFANLLAQFTNAHSTALWNASKAYVEADTYDDIAEYLENIALLDAEGSNETQRKAAARTSDEVVLARSLQKKRYHDYVRFRDEAKTLENRAKAISRIGGFVGDEAEGEDLRAAKPSSRGKSSGKDRGTGRGSGRPRSRR